MTHARRITPTSTGSRGGLQGEWLERALNEAWFHRSNDRPISSITGAVMRKMMMVAALAAMASATALHAQGNPPGGGRRGGMGMRGMGPGMMDAELLKGITLNDAQKAKLEQIRE